MPTDAHYELVFCPAWRALWEPSRILYPWLKFEWYWPENNNGEMSMSARIAAARMKCDHEIAEYAIYDLQAKGFLVVTGRAKGRAADTGSLFTYELTEIPLPAAEIGRRLYLDWAEGNDFPMYRVVPLKPSKQVEAQA